MRPRSALLLVPAVLLFFLATPACDDDGGGGTAVLTTYNIGLAHGFVDYALERRPVLTDMIKDMDADVICLQEVFRKDDIDAVVAGTKATFPWDHYMFIQDTSLAPASCTLAELAELKACVDNNCTGVATGELSGCVLTYCVAELAALPVNCQGCLAAQLGNSLEDIINTCTNPSVLYSYEGANGLLLLSKREMTNKTHKKLGSSLVQRSVLGATVALPGVGETEVYCTHLASDLSHLIPYPGRFGSFKMENIAQTQEMLAHIDANGTGSGTTIILGDMNSGLEYTAQGIVAEIPDAAYQVLVDAGYTSWPAGEAAPFCTHCDDNSHQNDAAGRSSMIDHVFFKGLSSGAKVSSARIGATRIEITDQNNTTVMIHPSDHYGVRVQVDL